MAKNEVAVQENFNLVTLEGEIAEAIAEEMNGLGTLPFDKVKIPSGGGLAFELPGEDEDNPETVTEIKGVILHHYPVNAYWKEAYNGEIAQPDCSSLGGKQGIRAETGEVVDCASCPYNQYGSNDGNGKACKNTHRCYVLREDNPIPVLITLPPTSLKHLRDYIGKRIVLKGLRSYDAITKLTLKKEKSSSGITYSRAAFTFVSKLTNEQRASAKAMADTIKNMVQPDVTVDDYNVVPAKPKSDFVETNTDEAVPVEFTEVEAVE